MIDFVDKKNLFSGTLESSREKWDFYCKKSDKMKELSDWMHESTINFNVGRDSMTRQFVVWFKNTSFSVMMFSPEGAPSVIFHLRHSGAQEWVRLREPKNIAWMINALDKMR